MMKNKKKIVAMACAALMIPSFWGLNVYAENQKPLLKEAVANSHADEYRELDAYLKQNVNKPVKLTSKVKSSEVMSPEEKQKWHEENAKAAAKKRAARGVTESKNTKIGLNLSPAEPRKNVTIGRQKPTISTYYLDETKKIYGYGKDVLKKLQAGESLENEMFTWEVPIINNLGEKGFIHLEREDETNEIVARSMEYPFDNREMLLSYGEIEGLVSKYTNNAFGIKNICFANFPFSSNGIIIGIITLDSGEMVFATVENVPHYGGMEYNKIYTLDEMTGYIQHYDKAMEEHIKFINKLKKQ